MKSKEILAFSMIVVLLSSASLVSAAPGDLIQNVNLPVAGVGVSVAVDCFGNVYYTLAGDGNLYQMDKDGTLLATLPILDAAGNSLEIDEMAFQNSGGAGTLWGQLHGSNPIDVYTIDPLTGAATLAFTSATISLGTFRDGIAFDASDNSIWISGDVSTTIEHYDLVGTLLGSITPTDAAGNIMGVISGITIGTGDLMYCGRNGLVEIVQIKKSTGEFISSFASPGGARDEGLECDAVNFAPLLALWSREFNPPGFLSVIEIESGTCACGGGEVDTVDVDVDIKPTSCPNPFELKADGSIFTQDDRFNLYRVETAVAAPASDKSVLPVAVLGSADLDVTTIDPETVLLNGVPPLRWSIGDVAGPVGEDAEECECTTAGPDGFPDLLLKYNRAAIAATLGPVTDGESIPLVLSGQLTDGTAFAGSDCILIRLKGGSTLNGTEDGNPFALQSHPNPFNAATVVNYTLKESGDVNLAIYNVLGQRVTTLVDEYQSAGEHNVTWNAGDVASGMYLYRLQVGTQIVTRKMTVLK